MRAMAAWMKAAGRNGIPSAFVVDQSGTIAWIGHPGTLDMVLDEVTRGVWDVAKGPDRIKAARKDVTDSLAKYSDGVDAGDAAWKAAEAKHPFLARTMQDDRYAAVIKAGHYKAGYALGRMLMEEGNAPDVLISSVLTPMLNSRRRSRRRSPSKGRCVRMSTASLGTHIKMAGPFPAGRYRRAGPRAKAVEVAPEDQVDRYRT
jgi:hypothetical protein